MSIEGYVSSLENEMYANGLHSENKKNRKSMERCNYTLNFMTLIHAFLQLIFYSTVIVN